MSTPASVRASILTILLGALFLIAASGCGRSGTAQPLFGGDGGVTSNGDGGQGGASNLGGGTASGGQSGTIISPRVPIDHRAQANSCEGVFAPPEPVDPPATSNCQKHADCTQGKNGRCITGNMGAGRGQYYFCTYDTCATDADCTSGKVCFCGAGNSPYCFQVGNCRTDADCGGGMYGYCSPAYGGDCGGYHWYSGYYCHTPKDTCLDNKDCTGNDYCDFDVIDGRWECKSPNMLCAIG